MTTQEAIKKAIEGGWRSNDELIKKESRFYDPYQFISSAVNNKGTFIDPQFWQCLGKAIPFKGRPSDEDNRPWLREWHSFIDHLAEGKTIEDYFKQLR